MHILTLKVAESRLLSEAGIPGGRRLLENWIVRFHDIEDPMFCVSAQITAFKINLEIEERVIFYLSHTFRLNLKKGDFDIFGIEGYWIAYFPDKHPKWYFLGTDGAHRDQMIPIEAEIL
jgi:hypothetical protein